MTICYLEYKNFILIIDERWWVIGKNVVKKRDDSEGGLATIQYFQQFAPSFAVIIGMKAFCL